MSNIINFPFTRIEEGVLTPRYEKFSEILSQNFSHVDTTLTEANWMSDWIDRSIKLLGEKDREGIYSDESPLMLMMTNTKILARLLDEILYLHHPWRQEIILVDNPSPEEVIDYPSPMFIFRVGRSVSLFTQLFIFENEATPEKIFEQSKINHGSRKVNCLKIKNNADPFKEFEIELLESLLVQFRKESLAVQRGWVIKETENSYVFSFISPVALNRFQSWNLSFKKETFEIELK